MSHSDKENNEKESAIQKLIDNIKKSGTNIEELLNNLSVAPTKKEHRFWSTQPVPQPNEQNATSSEAELKNKCANGPIQQENEIILSHDPLPLPADFEWCQVDLSQEKPSGPNETLPIDELYSLLKNHYVEDTDSKFRFDYSKSFLRWALMPPGSKLEWHVGVRVKSSKKLVAFIGATPLKMAVCTKDDSASSVACVEINFLCVHKKIRSKRLTPVLIREITRRVNLTKIFQAVYTAGILLPEPISTAQYFHRSLSPEKLISSGFSCLPRGETIKEVIFRYCLPSTVKLPGWRKMVSDDFPQVYQLLCNYLIKFSFAPVFSKEEAFHWIIPRDEIIYTFVVEDINSFVSFYILPSSVLDNPNISEIRAAYLFYYGLENENDLNALMKASLIEAKNLNCDVFNALDILNNESFLKSLKFGRGDGRLHYYMFNWKTETKSPNEIGFIML